jgi:hypothetical protein
MDNFTYTYLNYGSDSNGGEVCSKKSLINSKFSIRCGLNFQFSVFNSSLFSFHSYDQLGQLISDQQEMIASIEWRSGDKKIKKLTRTTTAGNKSNMECVKPFDTETFIM